MRLSQCAFIIRLLSVVSTGEWLLGASGSESGDWWRNADSQAMSVGPTMRVYTSYYFLHIKE